MKHVQTYTNLIEAELQAARAEQRDVNYQQVFMQQLQKHNLNGEHWLALLLPLLAMPENPQADVQTDINTLAQKRINDELAKMRKQAQELRDTAQLLEQRNISPTRPFILQLALPTDIPMAEVQQLASDIISATPGCKITADTKGINQAIAEQLQQQHPGIQLTHINPTTDEVSQPQASDQAEADRKVAEYLAQSLQKCHKQATDLKQVSDLLQRLPPEALALIESESRRLFAHLLTPKPPQG